jgi:pimeloyl-ACP methyl ester carboxylesterase
MPYVTSRDGTKIAYEEAGKGIPVILVDGALGHRGFMGMTPLADELAAGLHVWSYDRRGRGESGDTPPYAVEREIEDIEALGAEAHGPICLYGFSSGAVLALRAAAAMGERVSKLALLEPPLNEDDEASKREFAAFREHLSGLLAAGRRGDAVAYFLAGMVPPDVLEGMRGTPEWTQMEDVAHTLAYDNFVMGDGAVPLAAARAAKRPTLVLDGSDSPDFKHVAADALAAAMPHAVRMTIGGQSTLVPPDVLAPILKGFLQR